MSILQKATEVNQMFNELLSKTPSLGTTDKDSTEYKRRVCTGGPSPNISATPRQRLEGGPGGDYSNISQAVNSEKINDLQQTTAATQPGRVKKAKPSLKYKK